MFTHTYICIRAALRSAANQKAEEHLLKHDRDSEDTTKLYLAALRKLRPRRKHTSQHNLKQTMFGLADCVLNLSAAAASL